MTDSAPPGTRLPLPDQVTSIYLDHKGPLLRFLARTLGNSRDAEDVAHETFARLLTLRADRIDSPMALLKRIAVNILRDGFRAERYRRERMLGLEEPPLTSQPEPDPEQILCGRQRLLRLRDAIDTLPPRCREVFVLHKVHGKSHSEVAATLGISRNMVERHIIRAYAQLRETMDDEPRQGVDKTAARRA